MDENKLNELINKTIDQCISTEEKDLLDRILEESPQGTQRYINLKHVTGILNSVTAVEPPKSLKHNILKQIDSKRYEPKTASRNLLRSRVEWFLKPKPRLAFAFFTGMIIGAVLLALLLVGWLSQYPISNLNLMGTIGIRNHPAIETLYDIPLTTGESSASIRVNRFNQLVWLQINLSAQNNFELNLEYDPKSLNYDHIFPLTSGEISVKFADNGIMLSGKQGGQIVLFFVKSKPLATMITATLLMNQNKGIIQKIEIGQ